MKLKIWHLGSTQSGALRLAKSDGMLAEPLRCLIETWYLLTTGRKDRTRGLAENSPLHNFSNALTHGLLSINKQELCFDCIM